MILLCMQQRYRPCMIPCYACNPLWDPMDVGHVWKEPSHLFGGCFHIYEPFHHICRALLLKSACANFTLWITYRWFKYAWYPSKNSDLCIYCAPFPVQQNRLALIAPHSQLISTDTMPSGNPCAIGLDADILHNKLLIWEAVNMIYKPFTSLGYL